MSQYAYSINALVEFPALRRGQTVTGRATRTGEIVTQAPAGETDLRRAVARNVATQNGIEPDDIVFVTFTYTELLTT